MKKVIAVTMALAMLLGICPGMFTVTQAKDLSALQRIPLNYLDSDSDWKLATDSALPSPAVFFGTADAAKFDENTKLSGGNSADPISDAKAADDIYFKLENKSFPSQTDCYIDIINSRSPMDRYVLSAGDENVITLSMDVAIPGFSGNDKNIFACETNASVNANKNNKWEPATAVKGGGVFGSATLEENKWYNLTYEIGSAEDPKAVKYYVDGVLAGETALTNENLGLIRTGVQAKNGNVHTICYDNIYLNVGEPYSEARYHANRDASDLNFFTFAGENDGKDNVTSDLNLASYYDGMNEETSVAWSADSDVINCETGAVTRGVVDKNVKLTATITNGNCQNTKSFDLVVKANESDPQEVLDAKAKINGMISASEGKSADEYTETSFKALTDAISEARTVTEKADATLTELYAVSDKLTAAIDNLVTPSDPSYGAITNDANTQKGSPSTNFNSDTIVVKAGYGEGKGNTSRLGYIGTDVESVSPAAGKVYLKLYAKAAINDTASPISLYETSEFDETTLTYKNRPAPGDMIASVTNENNKEGPGWLTFDVTDYVTALGQKGLTKAWFALSTADTDNISNGFWSKEAADEELRPVIYGEGVNIGKAKDIDLNAIDIKALINNADVDSITKDLNELPVSGSVFGNTITWTSSNPEIISTEGKVTLPSEDTAVTLTAAINTDGVVHSRSFVLTVKVFNDVEYDKNELSFDSIKGENTADTAVTTKLNLISAGVKGSPITWTSSDEAVIAADGTVVRNALSNAKEVTLTATVGEGEDAVTKDIKVRVYGDKYIEDNGDSTVPVTIDGLTVTKEQTWRILGYTHEANGVKDKYLLYNASEGFDFVVKTDTATDMTVKFETSADGVTFTPFNDVEYVKTERPMGTFGGHNCGTYTSTAALPAGTKYLKVVAPDVDRAWRHRIESVEIFKADGELKFDDIKGGNYNGDTITESLSLPQTFNGSEIAWTSSNPDLIAADGTLSARPESDTPVTLTAVITNGAAVTTKAYNVTVKAYDDNLKFSDIPLVYYFGGSGGAQYVAMDNSRTLGKDRVLYSTADVLNISNETKNIVIVTVVYSGDGALLDAGFSKIEVAPASVPQTVTGELTLSNETEGIYSLATVKSFIWYDGSLAPLTGEYSVTLKK